MKMSVNGVLGWWTPTPGARLRRRRRCGGVLHDVSVRVVGVNREGGTGWGVAVGGSARFGEAGGEGLAV